MVAGVELEPQAASNGPTKPTQQASTHSGRRARMMAGAYAPWGVAPAGSSIGTPTNQQDQLRRESDNP